MNTKKIKDKLKKDEPLTWFELMMTNHYFEYFAVFFTIMIVELVNLKDMAEYFADETLGVKLFLVPFSFLPLVALFAIAYGGMYKHWKDYKFVIDKQKR